MDFGVSETSEQDFAAGGGFYVRDPAAKRHSLARAVLIKS